jgi:hypothetical protein
MNMDQISRPFMTLSCDGMGTAGQPGPRTLDGFTFDSLAELVDGVGCAPGFSMPPPELSLGGIVAPPFFCKGLASRSEHPIFAPSTSTLGSLFTHSRIQGESQSATAGLSSQPPTTSRLFSYVVGSSIGDSSGDSSRRPVPPEQKGLASQQENGACMTRAVPPAVCEAEAKNDDTGGGKVTPSMSAMAAPFRTAAPAPRVPPGRLGDHADGCTGGARGVVYKWALQGNTSIALPAAQMEHATFASVDNCANTSNTLRTRNVEQVGASTLLTACGKINAPFQPPVLCESDSMVSFTPTCGGGMPALELCSAPAASSMSGHPQYPHSPPDDSCLSGQNGGQPDNSEVPLSRRARALLQKWPEPPTRALPAKLTLRFSPADEHSFSVLRSIGCKSQLHLKARLDKSLSSIREYLMGKWSRLGHDAHRRMLIYTVGEYGSRLKWEASMGTMTVLQMMDLLGQKTANLALQSETLTLVYAFPRKAPVISEAVATVVKGRISQFHAGKDGELHAEAPAKCAILSRPQSCVPSKSLNSAVIAPPAPVKLQEEGEELDGEEIIVAEGHVVMPALCVKQREAGRGPGHVKAPASGRSKSGKIGRDILAGVAETEHGPHSDLPSGSSCNSIFVPASDFGTEAPAGAKKQRCH